MMNVDFVKLSQGVSKYAVDVRRYLHVHAEPTSREFETVKFIQRELEKIGLKYVNIPDGGVLAEVNGDGSSHSNVLLRADCDALEMTEAPDNAAGRKDCISSNPHAAHMCGHDAHTAILLGAAKILAQMDPQLIRGKVYLLFERGEEGGNCIYYVMKYIQQHKIRIDSCFALHVEPDLPVGTFWIDKGPSNAGNVNFEILLRGKGGHGSRPDLANNPLDCFVAIVNQMKDIRYKYIAPNDLLTYNIGSVHCGTRRNIVPDMLEFKGTARFYNTEAGKIFKTKLRHIIDHCADLYDCSAEYGVFSGPGLSVVNNGDAAQIAKDAVAEMYGHGCLKELPINLGSESFSMLSNFYPSVMIRLGIRNEERGITAGLHSPNFDLDEDAIPYGISAHLAYAVKYMRVADRKIPFKGIAQDADAVLRLTNRPIPNRYDPVSKQEG